MRCHRLKADEVKRRDKKDVDRGRQRDVRGRGRGRPEVIQSHSIFEQGPAEMMARRKGKDDCCDLSPSHGFERLTAFKRQQRQQYDTCDC